MIVYGTRSKPIASETIFDKCESCGHTNTELHLYQKYATLFWIPLFPMSKIGFSHCVHCKKELAPKDMPASLKLAYGNFKSKAKTPFWTFTGIILIAALVSFFIYQDKQNDKKIATLLKLPQKGDVFEVKLGNKQYTLYKVEDVVGDSVYVQMSDYETNKPSGLSDIKSKGASAYSEAMTVFSKSELNSKFDNGDIIDIDRK